jgi:hypothetical protein
MSNPVQERFSREYGMPLDQVEQLARLADQAKVCNEHACNGDTIMVPSGVPGERFLRVTDKNAAAKLWEAKVDETTKLIAALVKPYGFTAVVYTGLGPTLKRGEQFVEVPY